MPSVNWNSQYWSESYPWPEAGDEWSRAWGGSLAQWNFTILPRIRKWIPESSICEIAMGQGRWTRFLAKECAKLVGYDLSQQCVDKCKRKYEQHENIEFYKTDGYKLTETQPQTIDFVFSFDSLVHCESDVISSYVNEIMRILKPDGVAFLHHSNWAALTRKSDNTHCRGESVSAELMREWVQKSGGKILTQETINWGKVDLLDCLTTFTTEGGTHSVASETVIENRTFMLEAEICRSVISHYD